jgi:hypothetical protein
MKKDSIRTEEQKFEKNRPFIETLTECYPGIPQKIQNINFLIIDGRPDPEQIFDHR